MLVVVVRAGHGRGGLVVCCGCVCASGTCTCTRTKYPAAFPARCLAWIRLREFVGCACATAPLRCGLRALRPPPHHHLMCSTVWWRRGGGGMSTTVVGRAARCVCVLACAAVREHGTPSYPVHYATGPCSVLWGGGAGVRAHARHLNLRGNQVSGSFAGVVSGLSSLT